MRNLYVVESPLQALCALEVALGKKHELNDIIVRTSGGVSSRNDNQILSIIEKLDWNHKIIISNKKTSVRYFTYLENIGFLRSIEAKYKNKINSLYIGEFRSAFMHMVRTAVRAKNDFLLDDGAVTVNVISDYISKNKNYPEDIFYPKTRTKKIIYRLIFNKYTREGFLKKKIKVVTAFSNEKEDYIEHMSFENIKFLNSNKKTIDDSLVYYFGSLYSEAEIISRKYEVSILTKVKDFYDEQNRKVFYFAHRNESAEKLKFIEDNIGFKVIIPSTTAELYLLENEALPYEIAGAYTSVLNNIKVIFPEVRLRSFRFETAELCDRHRNAIVSLYDYYESMGIPIQG